MKSAFQKYQNSLPIYQIGLDNFFSQTLNFLFFLTSATIMPIRPKMMTYLEEAPAWFFDIIYEWQKKKNAAKHVFAPQCVP